nr:terminase gpA endonuclease subunit [Neoroseomonas eburnea]
MAAIDSGDGMTTAEVYSFVRRAGAGRAIAVKGQDGLRAAIGQPAATEVRRNGRKLGGLKVWPVGSSFLKAGPMAGSSSTAPPRRAVIRSPPASCTCRSMPPARSSVGSSPPSSWSPALAATAFAASNG